LREIKINGYIDEYVWWGDEITPDMLHESLYGAGNAFTDDVHIRLNSYGGSCNAAVRMHDDIKAYPGNVTIAISGTVASAGTILASAADKLEMTPGSLFFIHDPVVNAWGNERDLSEAINLLMACKESIINVYCTRCKKPRNEIAGMMTAATWMDARQALADGFIDGITDDATSTDPMNAVQPHVMNRKDAEAKVQEWLDRHNPVRLFGKIEAGKIKDGQTFAEQKRQEDMDDTKLTSEPVDIEERLVTTATKEPADEPPEKPTMNGTPIAQLEHRLGLIMPTRQKQGGRT
jgi:ATP-dependent protease ClpP protease subunit